MKVSEILTDESKWCRGYGAVDAEGKGVPTASDKAVKWCLVGAILKSSITPQAKYDKMSLHPETPTFYNVINQDQSKAMQARAITAIRALYKEQYTHVPDWNLLTTFNDDPKTSFVDIKAVIEHAKL